MIDRIKEYYTRAIRTSLLAYDKITDKWYHLFSVIELLPEDSYAYNIPNNNWKNGCIRTKQSKLRDYSFYLNIDEISSIEKAIEIFNNPINTYNIDNQKIYFFNSSFIKEPSGESPLVLPSNLHNNEGLSSVLPKRKSGLLVWSLIDHERETEKRFIMPSFSKEMQAIQQLTFDWLGFDLIQKSEHIGNVYLSATNPYFIETAAI